MKKMKKVVNFSDSVRARLLAIAKREEIQLEYLLLRYAIERFLYRLGKSKYADRFVLKGATAFAVWLGPFVRVTRDADIEVFGFETPDAMIDVFKEICSLEYEEDAVEFDMESFTWETIRKDGDYPGTRIKFFAKIGGARVTLQFDIGIGDSVYPPPEKAEYPALLGQDAPCLRIYPRYTVVSEKFSNMIVRGMLNSRLKDYYDIWMLSRIFDFDGETLGEAVARTFERRRIKMPKSLPEAFSPSFAENPQKARQWQAFVASIGNAPRPESLAEAVSSICDFLSPLFDGENMIDLIWHSRQGQWIKK